LKVRKAHGIAAALALACFAALLLWLTRVPADVRPAERAVIAMSSFVLSSPVFVADVEGCFRRQGLAVEIAPVQTGREALEAMFSGRADFAVSGSLPLAHVILDGRTPHIIATITKTDRDLVVVARGSRGIGNASDLRGKKVAIARGTSFDYFLDTVLVDAGVKPSTVTKVDTLPKAALQALEDGAVDAAVLASPLTEQALETLGPSAVQLAPPVYTTHWNIAASERTLALRPAVVEKMLRALLDAESFIHDRPDQATTDTASAMHVPRQEVASRWDNFLFRVQLPQSLIVAMEDETRWMISTRDAKSPATPLPNFLDYLDVEPLRKVRPEAIRITR
jgi:ABC-type nitrate/sulfonate/bicarbonate transport system substrate-binding protein